MIDLELNDIPEPAKRPGNRPASVACPTCGAPMVLRYSSDDGPAVLMCDACDLPARLRAIEEAEQAEAAAIDAEQAESVEATSVVDHAAAASVVALIDAAPAAPTIPSDALDLMTATAPAGPPATFEMAPRADGSCSCPPQTRMLAWFPSRGAAVGVCPTCGGTRQRPAPIVSARAAARAARPVVAGPTAATRIVINPRELVAGAAASGHGILVGWSGAGEITRSALAAILDGIDESGLMPAARSAHAHAAAATSMLTGVGFVVRAARPAQVTETITRADGSLAAVTRAQTPGERGWSARWNVGRVYGTGEVGEAFGRMTLTVSLGLDGELSVAGDPEIGDRVRAEFARLVGAEAYPAGVVTQWLRGVLTGTLHAVKLGGNFYIPAVSSERAGRLLVAMSASWGTEWMTGLPVATSAQLRAGLTLGLGAEVDDVLEELARARKAARDAGRQDVGTRAAMSSLARLREVNDRCVAYAALVDDEHVGILRAKVTAAIETITPLLDDTSARFAALELS